MKVKIVKSNGPTWCQENLGKEFEVIEEFELMYQIKTTAKH
jgi:hypothetical protein